ncbi:initiator tRNA phosphoribosyl transferase [Trametes coccinea BRFM310]|uniref:Initiator tRNA phosphoribosyl transferase n=1 Tax=Trametes coccinea (strain BRFM310) TaxID=1353009 RepID=A0A1Y2I7B2_TRAC3|nr:initiator tRNA phosphoribosyl transferase [Trametes coccinea BRFM310]
MNFEYDARQANAEALAYVRKQSLDIYNRLHSIQEDVRFVLQVHQAYPSLPVLPNLRCGAWYVDPSIATNDPAYFKSTDGHFGNWSFNLRRPNLHLLPVIIANGGAILVDSTRAGKRIPDALSKTVPIWCAVINRAMAIMHPDKEDWDAELYCPPASVSEQERVQIKARIEEWAVALTKSAYTIPPLPLPLRPLWITPATSGFPRLPDRADLAYLPILCVSASRQVEDGLERRSHGFAYVQGSGDDHELWGMGLTPDIFWANKERLLRSTREQLPSVVEEVVAAAKDSGVRENWNRSPTPIIAVDGRLLISAVPDMPANLPATLPGTQYSTSYVVISADVVSAQESDHAGTTSSPQNALRLKMAEGKKDQLHFLQSVLPESMQYIKARLAKGDAVCVCCDTGRDASVGVALAALQLFFDEKGKLLLENDGATRTPQAHANKTSIKTRLQWIISSRPEANPSRVTLKRVNEFLLSPPSFRRK